jgi:hypothetical protein
VIIAYDLGRHLFNPHARPVENARALRVLLESLIALDRDHLRDHTERPLYRAGVVYGRTRRWLTIPSLYDNGYGDCKSLTAALIAEYRNHGIPAKPVFRWIQNRKTKFRDFHILVQTDSGYEDPSKVLGMGQDYDVIEVID